MKTSRSWLSLLIFCASASLAAALVLAAVFTGASVVMAAAVPATTIAEEPTTPLFSGVISDLQCGARHRKESGKSPAECTLACVRNGGKYSLVNGDKKYALQGNADELSHWAGQRVTIAGVLSGDTIKVTSVSSPR